MRKGTRKTEIELKEKGNRMRGRWVHAENKEKIEIELKERENRMRGGWVHAENKDRKRPVSARHVFLL